MYIVIVGEGINKMFNFNTTKMKLLFKAVKLGKLVLQELKVLQGTPAQSQLGELVQFALT